MGHDGSAALPIGTLHVSIVAAIDGVRFAAVGVSEEHCMAQMALYVAEQAPLQLWPRSAQRVRELLSGGDTPDAVAEYFRRSGERWDREWLVTARLHPDSGAGAWSGPVPLPGRARFGAGDLPG
ncbi:MAG TPA: hypothetical protein VJT33_14485 [bacterium]|nr:hypothetical protein [bacterium]